MKKFVLTPLAAAVLSASAYAADKAPKTFTLDKVTVAATLNEQKVADVANTVSVIDAESIERNGATNIREMLRYEPGVEVGSAGRFGLSGFNIRGMSANRVKILVDGVEQAKDFNSGGPYLRGTRNFVDVDSLKQVDIVKGPASSLYGSDALGGVVAFTTKDAADYLGQGDDTSASVKGQYNSVDDSFNKTLTVANRSGNLESLLVYTHRTGNEYENYGDGYTGGQGNDRTKPDPVDFTSQNVLAKLAYQLSDNHRIGLNVEHFENNTETDLLSLEGTSYSATYDYADYTGDDTMKRNRVGIFHKISAENILFDTLEWKVDWQKSTTEQESRNTSYAYSFGGTRLIDYSHEEESKQFNLVASKEIANHTLTYGGKYVKDSLENSTDKFYLTSGDPADIERYTPVVEAKSYGIFLQDQISLLNDKLSLVAGLRYDSFTAEPETDSVYTTEFDDHDSDKWTARLGGVYKITDNHSVFAQYSQGFKAPDLTQLYREDTSTVVRGYVTLANPNLKPEESDSFEIGFRTNGNWGNAEIAAFYNDYDNFIDSTINPDVAYPNPFFGMFGGPTTDVDEFIYKNTDEATIKGVELRAALWLDELIQAPSGTSLNISIAYADGEGKSEGESNEPIDSISPLKGVFGLNYDSPDNSWGSTLNWTLASEKESSDVTELESSGVIYEQATTSGYGILDLTAYYNVNENLSIKGGIYNLTDKEYTLWEDLRGERADRTYLDRFSQPGRNFSVSATYTF
ncbi:TonB-dependent hemoglobin/transferrin/lactoferrin family receptor [Maricurvus nonylphenolicus]|uniref:TonB-dependent hemoglobin/transferrin/lactoferrin family receptor n=1 Tax=Maricurvus nonylphenolicus TaxID=1008307 RepID=UPI0036F3E7E0